MKPNFSGTWKADFARSHFAGASPKALLAFIAHDGDAIRQEMHVTRSDDSEQRILFECSTSSTKQAMLNGNNIRCSASWNGDDLLIETWPQIGSRQLHLCDSWSLSADRMVLLMEHHEGDLKGQFVIFDRQL